MSDSEDLKPNTSLESDVENPTPPKSILEQSDVESDVESDIDSIGSDLEKGTSDVEEGAAEASQTSIDTPEIGSSEMEDEEEDSEEEEDNNLGKNMPCQGFETYIKRRNDDSDRCDYYIMIPDSIVNKYPELKNNNKLKKNITGYGKSGLSLVSKPGTVDLVQDVDDEDLDKDCKNKLLAVRFKTNINDLTPEEKQLLINAEKRERKKNKESETSSESKSLVQEASSLSSAPWISEEGVIKDDTEESEEDEDIYQKLDTDINSTHLVEKHPGITQSSYAEILTMTNVVRNDKGEIIDGLHKTYPFITKYEKAKIIGVRTKQLNNGADPFIDINSDMIDGYHIALQEFEKKKLPFIIARPLPNGSREYWKLTDLELVHY